MPTRLFKSRRNFNRLAVGGAALAAMPLAFAKFPDKTVYLVVPFAPGGSTDVLARQLAEKLTAALGQTVVVLNKPGAGGTIGADFVAKGPADGSTLLMGVTGSNAIAESLYPDLPYNAATDFAPISEVVSAPLVLVVNSASSIKTVEQYIAAAKLKPLSYGSPGSGTSMHLTGAMFQLDTGAPLTHVAYRGSALALTDLLGGVLDSMFGDLLVVLPRVQAGALRAIAVTSRQRHPLLPEVPTIAESGVPALKNFEAISWQGVFAPAATPSDVVMRLNAEIIKALANPELKDTFSRQGFIVAGSTPEQFRALVDAEIPKWARVVKASGATAS
jgi:tripartite-type tricarboxylate transporter receptor subunit TctC